MTDDAHLLAVKNLHVGFDVRRGRLGRVAGRVHAVEDISFDVARGATLGIVGESGCGKTTVARAVLRLVEADRGEIRFDGVDVLHASGSKMRRVRRGMQMVFQDTVGSLNPRMTVEHIIGEPLAIHGVDTRRGRRALVAAVMERVGLPSSWMDRYPHEFSGGQRQRIGIARAIVLQPKLVVCDEPVSALDVSVQAQILNLLDDLQRQMKLSYLFIAHNLAVVEHFAERVAVMYLGRIVEVAPCAVLFEHPQHPYTQALLAAVPQPDPSSQRHRVPLSGDVPSPIDPPMGCAFHPRCRFASEQCQQVTPQLRRHAEASDKHLRCDVERTGEHQQRVQVAACEHLTACHHTAEASFAPRGVGS